ncbi:MAG: hypothetical protein K2G70_04455 [Turicibacter sp.]|nr:hypothetical protein [Turicibacter sp.]
MSIKQIILSRLSQIQREGISDLIHFLTIESDYFIAPASIKGHSNYPHGLAIHSHHVVELLLQKNAQFQLGLPIESIYLAGYLHDLCKTNLFTPILKLRYNQKNEKECYFTYDCCDNLPLGHGEKSVMIAQQYIRLTTEEMMMIRWHGGPNPSSESAYRYEQALSLYPVKAIFTADEEAATFLEKTKETAIFQTSVFYNWKKTGILPKLK